MVQREVKSDGMSLSKEKQWRPRGNIFKVHEAKGFIWEVVTGPPFLPKCGQLTPKREIKSVSL